ncbi:MAG: hypothetical protein OXI60_08985 [Acidiferrobacterales bacterium]|nr:hypothetical protein [Acidiferrobacterales bacterium]
MKVLGKFFILLAILAAPAVCAQSEYQVLIPRYEWPDDASADVVLQIPQIRSAVAKLLESENAQLIIRYPGGDEGNQWALDLRAMLVGLGIESKHIVLEPGSGIDETMAVIVAPKRGS